MVAKENTKNILDYNKIQAAKYKYVYQYGPSIFLLRKKMVNWIVKKTTVPYTDLQKWMTLSISGLMRL